MARSIVSVLVSAFTETSFTYDTAVMLLAVMSGSMQGVMLRSSDVKSPEESVMKFGLLENELFYFTTMSSKL